MRTTATALAAALSIATSTLAGDLDPPAGPVAPTMKALDVAEPRIPIGPDTTPGDADSIFRITQPGSYYLAANVAGEAGKHGIEVAPATCGLVTIDLRGHSVVGVAGSLDGISAGSVRCNIGNGAVDQWGGNGVVVGEGTIQNVTALSNGNIGIRAAWGNLITNCRSESNGGDGISCGDVSHVCGCVSKGNVGLGITLDGAGTIADNVLYANQGGGIKTGIAIIDGNYLFSNNGISIDDNGRSTITNNTVVSGGVGIRSGGGSRVESNYATLCITGYDIDGEDNIVLKNTANGCTTAFDIGPDNSHGPILDVTATDDISTLAGADHPWANFIH